MEYDAFFNSDALMRYLCVLLLLLASYGPSFAQKEFRTWCFGADLYAGTVAGLGVGITLTFDDNGPVQPSGSCRVYEYAPYRSLPGSSNINSICDADGNLLLYSYGAKLFNQQQQVVPGGDLLNDGVTPAQLSNFWAGVLFQPCVFAPGPDGNYYLFYWNLAAGASAYQLCYAVVDVRQNGGSGAVIRKGQLLPTFLPHFTVVRHRNNRDFWLVGRDLESRGFRAYRLGPHGVEPTPVVSLAGVALYPNGIELKAAPNGRRLVCGVAASYAYTPQHALALYDFDNATGAVSNELVVPRTPANTPPTNTFQGRPSNFTQGGTLSFSPDSRLLYSTEDNLNPLDPRRYGDLWQYDLTQPTAGAVTRSRFLVSNVAVPASITSHSYFGCSGLQLAPDGTLWVANYTSAAFDPATQRLAPLSSCIVRHPNVAGAGCGFVLDGYTYQPGKLPLWTFPNLITNMLYAPPVLNYEQGCAEDSVRFWASSAGLPAGLRWDFGDPASGAANAATGQYATHAYGWGGEYPVRLLLADGRVLTQTVPISGQAVDFTNENIFTPNADGRNDEFVPVRQPLPGGRLQVFGRWGQRVYHTTDPALRWDGAGVAAGEYTYLLEYPACDGATRRRRGLLTLVR